MKKLAKKLALSRETLRHLQTPHLRQIHGAESGTCPTDCAYTAACTVGCTDTCTCTNTAECPETNTCPPGSYAYSGCAICG